MKRSILISLTLAAACAETRAPRPEVETNPSAMTTEMRAQILESVSRSSEQLVREQRPDGISRVRLRRRFQAAAVMTFDAEGRAVRSCIEDPVKLREMLGEGDR